MDEGGGKREEAKSDREGQGKTRGEDEGNR